MRALIGAALCGMLLTGTAGAARHRRPQPPPDQSVGVVSRVFHPKETRNWRGDPQKDLRCVLWYPAIATAVQIQQVIGPPDAPLFGAGMASPNAQFAPSLGRFPLILLSPAEGGSALQMAWLGTALARAGYIAVAVDHPGSNSNGRVTPEGVALWWERATDISDVLDGMLADPTFAPHIDPSRIAAAGDSIGGYTVLELAGARTDISAFFDLCQATPDADACNLPGMHGMGSPQDVLRAVRRSSAISLASSGESFRDPRIKAVFALAPALGFTLTPDSLRAIRLPVEIVVGADDRIAPPQGSADWIRDNLHGARESVLPGVGHYAFLDTCTAQGERDPALDCGPSSAPGRPAVHAQVAAMAVAFFDRALRLR